MKKLLFIGFLLIALGWTASAQTEKVTFEKVILTDVGSIFMPSIMEVQTGIYKKLSDKTFNEKLKPLGFELSGDEIIFQQKGLNDLNKTNTYARVIIETTIGKPKEFPKLTDKIKLTQKQIQQFDDAAKSEFVSNFSSIGMKLLRWDGYSIVDMNGRSALKLSYLRQYATNPPVYVEIYQFKNYDREHMLTISYREEDAKIWKDVLDDVKNSFTITNVR